METILVTGSNGFLGEEVINSLCDGYNVLALDKNDQVFFSSNANITKLKNNINELSKLEDIFQNRKIDIVIHCAAEILDAEDSNEVWKTNYHGTKNLLDLSEKYDVKKFIFTSTFSIFEKSYISSIDENELPSAIVDYGKSKYAAENLILRHSYNNDVVIFRCPVIIGKKRLDKLCLLFEMVHKNISLWLIGSGMNKIHFIYSSDLISAIKLSMRLRGKHLFNIGSDNVKSLNVVFQKLIDHAKSNTKIRKIPQLFGIFCINLAFLLKIVSLGPYHQRMLVSNLVLNTDRIKKKLNWAPKYSNEDMLMECYDHYISTIGQAKDVSSSKKIPNLKILKILRFLDKFI
jgi:UDP-glucose 4-epimerase|tara:strand:+ start:4598 stop:5635 length:1038 start_codon:yes stop_codon:yes gene_type:complete